MKRTIQLASLTALAAILGGCAGYNTTMFMTKSNAGLDIDMKPPTAEINISRKEAVIEPAFEKGQTPPVMASFKPNVGFGGRMGNYFLGVDQTFAGGDAALTMAMLYDASTPTIVKDGEFDSTLNITNNNSNTNHCWFYREFFTPANPDEIRPFIFGTDTQLGLKVAWSGAGGQFPDTVKAGFNRKEFAWAPITMSQDGKHIKMPSFLATIQSNIGGESATNKSNFTNITTKASSPRGGSGMVESITNIQLNVPDQSASVKSIQYFATGEAASQLARQKDVRDAMLKRLDPSYDSKTSFHNPFILRNMLFAMSSTFRALASSDPVAAGFTNKLSNLHGIDVPASFESVKPALYFYSFTPAAGTNNALLDKATSSSVPGIGSGSINTGLVNAYIDLLQKSTTNIELAQAQIKNGAPPKFTTDGGAPSDLSLTNSMEMQSQLDLQNQEINKITQQVSGNQDVLAAYDYFNHLTKQ